MAERDAEMAAAYGVSRERMHENSGFVSKSELPQEWSNPQKVGAIALVLGSPVLLVVVPLAAFFALVIGMVVVGAIVEPFDRAIHSAPFSPGRWESSDGEYWIQLDPDGAGDVRIPEYDVFGFSDCAGDDGVIHERVTWFYDPHPEGFRSWSHLTIDYDDPAGPCDGDYPFIRGGGWYDEYNWDDLEYSAVEPDVVDITFRKVGDEAT